MIEQGNGMCMRQVCVCMYVHVSVITCFLTYILFSAMSICREHFEG